MNVTSGTSSLSAAADSSLNYNTLLSIDKKMDDGDIRGGKMAITPNTNIPYQACRSNGGCNMVINMGSVIPIN